MARKVQWSKMGTARAFVNSKWFEDGIYLVKLAVKMVEEGHNGDAIVIECGVVAAEANSDTAPKPGQTAAQIIPISGKKADPGLGNFKQFIMAVLGVEDQDSLSNEEWAEIGEAVAEQGMFDGKFATLEVVTKPQKADPSKMFTHHNWRGEATPEDFAYFGVPVPE